MLLYVTGNTLLRKKTARQCTVKFCTSEVRDHRPRCHKHEHQHIKETDLPRYSYKALRSNANRRGVDFLITLPEFREFCTRTNYIALKGRGSGRATIDRINPAIGYHIDNIQIMESSSNSRKQHVDRLNSLPDDHPAKPMPEVITEMYDSLDVYGNLCKRPPVDLSIPAPF